MNILDIPLITLSLGPFLIEYMHEAYRRGLDHECLIFNEHFNHLIIKSIHMCISSHRINEGARAPIMEIDATYILGK